MTSGAPMSYRVRVDYRTATSCNSITAEVVACSAEQAFELAGIAARRARPSIVEIDGGTLIGQPVEVRS